MGIERSDGCEALVRRDVVSSALVHRERTERMTGRSRVAVSIAVLALALAGCTDPDVGGSATAGEDPRSTVESAPAFVPATRDWSCPAGAPEAARCHVVDVPADWSDTDGPMVTLPVVVVPATGPDVRPDPLVVLAGGPGGSMTGVAAHWSDPHRDVVLYDQRGTGAAEPLLDCPERNEAWVANLQRDASFEVERAAIVAGFDRCRNRLEAGGVDLDDYDTEASVRDLDAIRTALGYREWNVLGISYGTRLALAAMRSTPEEIRSVILDSVDDVATGGPAAIRAFGDRAMTELAAACGEAAVCAASHPDLAAEIAEVERRYDASPVHVDVDVGDRGGSRSFVITGTDMVGGLFRALYDPMLVPLLPAIIGDLATGDTSIVAELIRQNVASQDEIAWAMHLSVNCADRADLNRAADADAIADPGRFRILVTEPLCSEWPVEPTSSSFTDPVHSDIPTLVLAGRFDPITPPANSRAAASRLERATFAEWPTHGHVITGDPCAETLTSAFLDEPFSAVDLSCVDALPSTPFE